MGYCPYVAHRIMSPQITSSRITIALFTGLMSNSSPTIYLMIPEALGKNLETQACQWALLIPLPSGVINPLRIPQLLMWSLLPNSCCLWDICMKPILAASLLALQQ